MGYQVIESQATLHWLESKRSVPEQLLSAAASHCIGQILKEGKTILLEPIMSVDITVPEERLNSVLADLGRRRAVILNVETKGENRTVQSEVPTAELVGYSSILRTITSGTASLLMTFADHKPMTEAQMDEMKNYGFHYKKFG
uniref:Ribosome-releasing factor 2, mitochondrial n=1 Tax=Lygus hesperus TaxID=30085 RepID=A0A146MG94_LYGHE